MDEQRRDQQRLLHHLAEHGLSFKVDGDQPLGSTNSRACLITVFLSKAIRSLVNSRCRSPILEASCGSRMTSLASAKGGHGVRPSRAAYQAGSIGMRTA